MRGPLAQNIIGLLALIVATAAAFMTYQQSKLLDVQTQTMQIQQRAAVWPSLVFQQRASRGLDDQPARFEVTVSNRGSGPALVRDFMILQRDGSINRDLLQAANKNAFAKIKGLITELNKPTQGIPISSNNSEILIEITMPEPDSENFREAMVSIQENRTPGFTLYICYCSILEDCWVSKSTAIGQNERIDEVESCKTLENYIRDDVKLEAQQ